MKKIARTLKTTNSELEIAREHAESAVKSKSEFLANMSHELRTPMTAILGFTDTLLENESDEENKDSIKVIQRNGKLLLNIINDILDLSKIEAGKMTMEHISHSPWSTVDEITDLMKVRAESKGITLKHECTTKIPKRISSDLYVFKQILMNLVGNAIKFTEIGSVTIRLSFDENSNNVLYSIIDTGIGLTVSQKEKLFSPFVQADTSTTRKFGGTGLGLTISQRFAKLLKGNIKVESEIEKGSIFTLSIDAGENVELIDFEFGNKNSKQSSDKQEIEITKTDEKPLENIYILLAEDGPDNQKLFSYILKKAGAVLTIVNNGQEAFEYAMKAFQNNKPYDIILMDMQMPILDGYDATKKLRENGYPHSIIALTAHAMKGDRDKCIDAGCNDYLSKPINREKLVYLARNHALMKQEFAI